MYNKGGDKETQEKNCINEAQTIEKQKNDHLREIEGLRLKRQTTEIEKDRVLEEFNYNEHQLKSLAGQSNQLAKKGVEVKEELAKMKEMEKNLNSDIENFIKEKHRLEMLVKSDETRNELEVELENLKELSNEKMVQAHEVKMKIQEQKEQLLNFQKFLQQAKDMTEKSNMNKVILNDTRKKEIEAEDKYNVVLGLNEELEDVRKQFEGLNRDCANANTGWMKKKGCLDVEIRDYEDQIQKIRQGMSEEDIAANDLTASIAKAKKKNAQLRHEMEIEVQQVRDEFQKLILSYQS